MPSKPTRRTRGVHDPLASLEYGAVPDWLPARVLERATQLDAGLVVYGADGAACAANAAACTMLGLSWDEVAGHTSLASSWVVVDADGRPMSPSRHPARLSSISGQPVQGFYCGVRRDDVVEPVLWLRVAVEPFPQGAPGECLGVAATLTDATAEAAGPTAEHSLLHRYQQVAGSTAVPPAVLFHHSPLGIVMLDHRGSIVTINETYAELLGRTVDDLVGVPLARYIVTLNDADRGLVADLADGRVESGQVDLTHASANSRWIRLRCYVHVDRRGAEPARTIIHAWDLTEQEHAIKQLTEVAASESTFRESLMGSAVPTALLDINGVVTEANAALESHLATPRDRLIGAPLDSFMSLSVVRSFHTEWDGFIDGRQSILRVRGEWLDGTGRHMWSDVSASLIRDGVLTSHVVLQVIDVSAEQRAMDQLAYRSSHDTLTGLPNRAEAIAALHSAGDRSATQRTCAAVFYIDVDNFKQINDGLSHEAGDQVLVEVGQRLRGALRPSDVVGRLGGDEFVVVLDDIDDPEDVVPIARALLVAVAQTVTVGGVRLLPTVSIGVAVGRGRVDSMALLREADDALRQAKSHGRNRWELYTPAMSRTAMDRLGIEAQIRDALQERRIEAHYQPVVDLATGRVVSYEALARIRQVSGSVAPNAEFIPVAEQSGLIVPIGREVILQAIEAASQMGPEIRMAVNASGPQLNDPAFADDVIGALYSHGLDARRLIIEVTETTILHLAHWAHSAIDRLVSLGVGLHVDDFGTGFSSISHLRDLPVTGMKLDRSFTSELASRASGSFRLAEGLASLANSLRLMTIAEGVETPLQRRLLQEAGWQCGQGWLFGRAEPTVY